MTHGLGWTVFQFTLLTFAAYVLQFVVTGSDWPPIRWFRVKLIARWPHRSDGPHPIVDFFTCPRCFGFIFTIAFFCVLGEPMGFDWQLSIPLFWAQAFAAASLVGLIGSREP